MLITGPCHALIGLQLFCIECPKYVLMQLQIVLLSWIMLLKTQENALINLKG